MITLSEIEFSRLADFVREHFGINLSNKKELIEVRLGTLLCELGFDNYTDFLEHVLKDTSGQSIMAMIDRLTTHHTFFMRESAHFDFYRDNILPILSKGSERDLRIWSAGCSTGQEAYSIAMINHEFFGDKRHFWDTKILATDLSEKALSKARHGVYTEEEIEGLPPLMRLKYCVKEENGYRISDEIKNEVIFRKFNLMERSFPFKRKFHVIFCRNVMIYFDQNARENLIKKFYDITEPGGYLFIGHSESINKTATNYKYIKPAIYRKE